MSEIARNLKTHMKPATGSPSSEAEKASADAGVRPAVKNDPKPVSTETGGNMARLLLRIWLGGGGLAAVALLFSAAGGPAAWMVLGIMTAGIVFIIIQLALAPADYGRAKAAPSTDELSRLVEEADHDRSWADAERSVRLAAIHDDLGDIALSRDSDRRIIDANQTFRRLTDCEQPEGKTCRELGLIFSPSTVPNRFEVEINAPSGKRIFIWHDITVRDPTSGQLIISSVGRDVTDERRLVRAQEEARLKAEQSNAAKSRLLATVSHEIRTPLSGIIGMSQLLEEAPLTPAQRNYLEGIRQSGDALVKLVEDLLDFSAMEAGRFELRQKPVALRKLVESVSEMLSHRAHDKGIEIATSIAADVPAILECDEARLKQVLFNVIGNAVKFTVKGGVQIRATREDDMAVISVIDTGPGMSDDEERRVFGEFEQAGNSEEKSAGSGLGLAISLRIMKAFGGDLKVASIKGKGSTFRILFPIRSEEHDDVVEARRQALAETSVLIIAPKGPAESALAATITTLGGTCSNAAGIDAAMEIISGGRAFTDIIVDNRLADAFNERMPQHLHDNGQSPRRILLVNPEERNAAGFGAFDAWLIRPLREQSLIDVLLGRMRGVERREAINDNARKYEFNLPKLSAPAGSGLKVLLGEDDPVNVMLVRAVLEKSGHTVEVCGDFEAMMTVLCSEPAARPDIIVTDLHMPGGHGLDILPKIREREMSLGSEQMPIIVLTGDKRDDIHRQALIAGANRVLTKPLDPAGLLAEITALSKDKPAVRKA
jgi:signal transduction histidine kinase/ActR/RegA family two-component response regulator